MVDQERPVPVVIMPGKQLGGPKLSKMKSQVTGAIWLAVFHSLKRQSVEPMMFLFG